MSIARQVYVIMPDIDRFSNYSRLKRSVAWIYRYVQNLLRKVRHEAPTKGELTVDEERQAETHLIQFVQERAYAEELADIKRNGAVSTCSTLRTLNPFIANDGMLRVCGRIERAACTSIEARQPIILPNNHRVTRLLAEYYHVKFLHINVATVMSEIRQRYWIPSLRRLLNSVQSRCQLCRVKRAKPQQPQMGVLPPDRVTPYVRPFTYTGLDFFGPISVTIRRQREKRWVALFTCLTVRAIHLEVATDLSSDACLICIRNFINRRGVPVVIRSDNGTNFVGIAKELQGVSSFLDSSSLTAGLTPLGIRWKFNTPANPSEGGAWERLVQSVKKALFTMLKEHSPRLETLQSLLIETGNMVNARPLTHLPVTPEEPEPLTPNHFLLGCPNSTQTPAPFDHRLLCVRKQWRVVQNLKNGMWHQWVREYLPELTRRTKWCLPEKPIQPGCLVLICEAESPRSQWKRGRVVELHYGRDGVARSAHVTTSSGVYRRPISRLAVLDVEPARTISEASSSGSAHGGGDVDDGNPTNVAEHE
ncbi:uncharacterized protein LOC118749837 [Rhagoletis pomonella]|uniref:uncharacterized protein LOC118749837 n=1 Tax=Rhagoletis pomonella TaxID=28610 RepID=UPI00178503B9|nr:uncharacterized protein LOC118749837 [Rhagoletis pomonella]